MRALPNICVDTLRPLSALEKTYKLLLKKR